MLCEQASTYQRNIRLGRRMDSQHPCRSGSARCPTGDAQIGNRDNLLWASYPPPFGLTTLFTKLPGAGFEHHAMHDGLKGEPQGCGE